MADRLRINFILPPVPSISGGPLAILEYANRFAARGHQVSITTYPNSTWPGDNPFPWFKLAPEVRLHYLADRRPQSERIELSLDNPEKVGRTLGRSLGLGGLIQAALTSTAEVPPNKGAFEFMVGEGLLWPRLIAAMPECDINIATLWSTAFPAYLSRKGKPTYFMQHYEEVFYPNEPASMMQRLGARLSYGLPTYKVANSSWLQKIILARYGQDVPFSNNGLDLADFNPRPKKSDSDGIIRVVTYSRSEQWKGFADAVAAMNRVKSEVGDLVEWHVFGYQHPSLPENNPYARYTYHPRLSFAALSNLYATSDIALCPSWYESFPLPPLEAMASGTAAITTGAGTEDYAFHEKNALVVGSRDIHGMADAVLRLIRQPELRQRLAAEGRITAETFGWDRAVEEREAILLAIHRGESTYDIERSAKFGELDANGLEFDRAPSDAGLDSDGLYWDGPSLYLLRDGVRHRIENSSLISELLERGARYIDIDALDCARTPIGAPLMTRADLPTKLTQHP